MRSKIVEMAHGPTVKGTASSLQRSDGMILVIGLRLESSVIFFTVQTHLSCRFLLAIDSLGLRRSGSSPQFIDPPQDLPKQVPRHRHVGQLERDVPAMTINLSSNLDQLLPQRGQRPVFHLLRQRKRPHEPGVKLLAKAFENVSNR